jgi:hypothetical protein
MKTMRDRGFVLIDSDIPGDRDALYFLRERKPFFPGTFFGSNVIIQTLKNNAT